jgi:exodeoxyribonuclease-3
MSCRPTQTSQIGWNALLQPESRARFAVFSPKVDHASTLHPSRAIYRDYKRNRWARDAGLRIDHLLLSRATAARLNDAGVDKAVRGRDGASDHAPAWIVLD